MVLLLSEFFKSMQKLSFDGNALNFAINVFFIILNNVWAIHSIALGRRWFGAASCVSRTGNIKLYRENASVSSSTMGMQINLLKCDNKFPLSRFKIQRILPAAVPPVHLNLWKNGQTIPEAQMSIYQKSLAPALHVVAFIEALGSDEKMHAPCLVCLARLPVFPGLILLNVPLERAGSWVCLQ